MSIAKINQRGKALIQLILVAILSVFLFVISVCGYDKPTVTSQSNYDEVPYHDLTITWAAPSSNYGTVVSYSFAVREFYLDNNDVWQPCSTYLINDNNVTTNSYVIYDYLLTHSTKYRFSISALMSNNQRIWSDEYYFYVSWHNGVSSYFRPLEFRLHQDFAPATKYQFGAACNAWNNLMNLGYSVVSKSSYENNLNTGSDTDFICTVTRYSSSSDGILMYTTRTYDYPSHEIQEADIYVNTYYNWTNSPQSNSYDVQSVFTHELGHALGLMDHYDTWSSDWTMYYFASVNSAAWRTLEYHDYMTAIRLNQ